MLFARILRSLCVFAACLGCATFLPAAPADDARAALMAGIDEVSAALRERPKQEDLVATLDTLADKHFAFATTTRLAVGRDWRDFAEADRARAVSLFSRLVVRTYAHRLQGEAKPAMTFGAPTELSPTRVEIPSTVTTNGATYAIIYRLEFDPAASSARWRVYDVVAEGVSLISNYRAQFAPIVAKSGAVGLLRTLEAKLAEPAPAS